MPTSNGRIYIDKSITPNIGISAKDVAECIGCGSEDIGTLCTSDNINMWARYKPFKHPSTGNITESYRQAANYGINISTFDQNDLQGMFNAAMSGDFGWSTEKPSGAPNERYRLLDFDQYNHKCKNPFYVDDFSYAGNLKIEVGQLPGLPDGNIQITDIKNQIGFDSPDGTGVGMIYRRNGGSLQHLSWDDPNTGDIKYPLSQSNTFTVSNDAGGTYEVCFYIIDSNRTGDAVLIPSDKTTFVVKKVEPMVKILNVYFEKSNTAGSKTRATFTIQGNRETPPVPDGYASLQLFDRNNKIIGGEFTEYIPELSKGATYTVSFGLDGDMEYDPIEIPYGDIKKWFIKYKGVELSGHLE